MIKRPGTYLIIWIASLCVAMFYFPHAYLEAFKIYVVSVVVFVSVAVNLIFQFAIHWLQVRPVIFKMFVAEMQAEEIHQQAVKKFGQRELAIGLDTARSHVD